jgi:hypothetical protein
VAESLAKRGEAHADLLSLTFGRSRLMEWLAKVMGKRSKVASLAAAVTKITSKAL